METTVQKTKVRRSTMTVMFNGHPGSSLDEDVRQIFVRHGGRLLNSGTFISTGERDVRYSVPRPDTKDIRHELKQLGLTSVTR